MSPSFNVYVYIRYFMFALFEHYVDQQRNDDMYDDAMHIIYKYT